MKSAPRRALLNRKLYLDGALFYYKYNNFQTLEQVGHDLRHHQCRQGGQLRLRSAGSLRPEPRSVSLFANYAFNHARFKTGVLDGNRFRLSPDHTFSAGRDALD